MRSRTAPFLTLAVATLFVGAREFRCQAATSIVLPPTAISSEANASMFWLASPFEARHQLLIDESVIKQHAKMRLVGLEIRRNTGQNDGLSAGRLWIEVEVSTNASAAVTASEDFGRNHGIDRSPTFSRWVDLPAVKASPRQPAEWNTPYAVKLTFQKPFEYKGGHLCIETRTRLTGPGNSKGTAPWWPIDAENATVGGSVRRIGTSCIPGLPGQPADASVESLTPGATAQFHLFGRSKTSRIAVFMIGTQATAIALDAFGAPNCVARLFADFVLTAPYDPFPMGEHGVATLSLPIPNLPNLVGARFHGQWLVADSRNALGLALSNSVEARLGASFKHEYAVVSAATATAPRGVVRLDRYPVVRLLFASAR